MGIVGSRIVPVQVTGDYLMSVNFLAFMDLQ